MRHDGGSAKLCALAAVGLAIVAAASAGCDHTKTASASPREATAPKVTVVRARKMDVPFIRVPNGTTKALNEVTIRARVKGFLKEVHFSEGSNVKSGQLLMVIEEDPFKVKVDQAKAALAEAVAALERAQESRAKEVAKARVALDEAQLALDKVEERRERNLLARHAASQEDYDQSKVKVDKSIAQVEADSATLLQTTADYKIDLLSAQAKVDQAKADLEAAKIDLGYCQMYAPIDGRIGELQVKRGNLVGPATSKDDTTSLVSIQQLNPMGVDIRPASRYLPIITKLVQKGLEVKLRVGGQKVHPHTGKVAFVDNTVDPTTSTVLVKAAVPNPDETLLPGEYVKVEVNVGDYAGAFVIPEAAVIEAQEGSVVLVVGSEDKVERVLVKPLDLYQGLRVIESGLGEGQKVIVKGVQLVRPGQIVKTEESELKNFIKPDSDSEDDESLNSPLLRIRGDSQGGSIPPSSSETGKTPSTSGGVGRTQRLEPADRSSSSGSTR
jgi:RND family efflux transporter MFP subunit